MKFFFFLFFFGGNKRSYLDNIKLIQHQQYPTVEHIVYYSQGRPNPLQNISIQNWDRYYKQTKDVVGEFPALQVHPRIRLLHSICDALAPPIPAP